MGRLFRTHSRGLRKNGQTIWCLNRQLYRIILNIISEAVHRVLNAAAHRAAVVIVFLLKMRLRACLADGSKYGGHAGIEIETLAKQHMIVVV